MKRHIENRLPIDFPSLTLFQTLFEIVQFFAMEHFQALAISDGKVTSNHALLPLKTYRADGEASEFLSKGLVNSR